jgi:hypothetical protein
LAGEKPNGCTGSLEGFLVKNGSSLLSYVVEAECTITNSPQTEYVLGENVQLLNALSEDILFMVLRNGVVGAQTITLTTTSGSFSYQVVVEQSGVIRGNWL